MKATTAFLVTPSSDQFHQHFMSRAFASILLCQKSSNLKCNYKKLRAKLSYKKSLTQNVGEIDTSSSSSGMCQSKTYFFDTEEK
jgi:hypothetical protein